MATSTYQRIGALCSKSPVKSFSMSTTAPFSPSKRLLTKRFSSQPKCAVSLSFFRSHHLRSRTLLIGPHCACAASQPYNNTLCRFAHTSIVSKLTEDLDLDKMREDARKEMQETGENVLVIEKVKELVAKRCRERIMNLSAEDRKKLQVLQLEHSFMYSEGYQITSPDEMTDENWLETLNLQTKTQRLKYYLFLMKRLHKKAASEKKKQEKRESAVEREKEVYEHGRIFMRIYQSTMNKWLNHRLAASMCYGIPLVFDMNYVDFMRPQEQKNTADQLHDVYSLNRADEKEPFHLFFTDCAEHNPVDRFVQFRLQDNVHFMATVTPDSYLETFDKENIVYLSPHARKVMTKFDPKAVYVIGAFNDKATNQPVSYGRAMEQELNCMRLPLDEHLDWSNGNKALTLDVMFKIMASLKNGHTWKEALRHVPKRKLKYR